MLVTRPAGQAAAWVERLRLLQVAADALPLIEIGPAAEPTSLLQAWAGLAHRDLVMFVSANAVQGFFAAAAQPAAWPKGLRAAATGPGTVRALRDAGVPEAAIVAPPEQGSQFDSEALWLRLRHEIWAARSVLIVRGSVQGRLAGRDWLAETLRAAGATVGFCAAYERRMPAWSAAEQALLHQAKAQPGSHLWLFSASEAVSALAALAPPGTWPGARALATHPRIAATLHEAGWSRVLPVEPRPEAVAALVLGLTNGREDGDKGESGPAGGPLPLAGAPIESRPP